ncbi:MAG TPA: flagellin lysine-N-methylase [Methylomusa anaerophila]|nr:flagellin lysine-N-methylase [Methylomusa anaerophila]HML88327.1 flagellin lysine-N-methylase [Methylomusa anaerophila]
MYIYTDLCEHFACGMCGSCCRNDWLITVDEESYRRNALLFGKTGREEEFGKAFVPILNPNANCVGEYAYIAKQANGSCWFLNGDNRCRLQVEAGHGHLDAVCQTYPRYPINTTRGVELTLSFSCPTVLKLAMRPQPLAIVRSEHAPLVFSLDSCVAAVYPRQQPPSDPLRYYFELEHHFIDILQCRGLTIEERLGLIETTVSGLLKIGRSDGINQGLDMIIHNNYTIMDSKSEAAGQWCACPTDMLTDILVEHFFVNFIFKKPFYLYGLERTAKLLRHMWGRFQARGKKESDRLGDMERICSVITAIEFEYGHNRKALLMPDNF